MRAKKYRLLWNNDTSFKFAYKDVEGKTVMATIPPGGEMVIEAHPSWEPPKFAALKFQIMGYGQETETDGSSGQKIKTSEKEKKRKKSK